MEMNCTQNAWMLRHEGFDRRNSNPVTVGALCASALSLDKLSTIQRMASVWLLWWRLNAV